MGLFRKKAAEPAKKAKASEEPVELRPPVQHRIITAEGWRRKILGKPSEIVSKKRGS